MTSGRTPSGAVALGVSVIGARHVREDKPCQDAIAWALRGDALAMAVADGHGTAAHGDVGARLAVQTAVEGLLAFADQVSTPDVFEIGRLAGDPLRQHLVRAWRERVREHGPESDAREYGSTLLFALATPRVLVIGQLGDGDVLLECGSGTAERPLPDDAACFGDTTTSLCLPEAWLALRVRALPPPKEGVLLLATDGYGNSYPTTTAFDQIAPDYLALLREHGAGAVSDLLPEFLSQVTVGGSGDDITLGLIFWPTSPETT